MLPGTDQFVTLTQSTDIVSGRKSAPKSNPVPCIGKFVKNQMIGSAHHAPGKT